MNAETLENMLARFLASQADEGTDADYYRLVNREAARECAAWLADNPGATARDALIANGEAWQLSAPEFHAYLSEIAEVQSI